MKGKNLASVKKNVYNADNVNKEPRPVFFA